MMATGMALLVAGGAGSGAETNRAHEMLAAMSEIDRSGRPCPTVARTFFQGLDTKGNAIWNVECAGGQSYVVEIKNDRDGSTLVINCRTLYAAGGGTCFKRLE